MKKRGRTIAFAGITGIIVAFCYVAGASLDLYDTLDFMDKEFYGKWLFASVLLGSLFFAVWKVIFRHEKKDTGACVWRLFQWRFDLPVVWCAVILFICWLPAFFSIFPGAFGYDALQEWQEVRDGVITSHHPVIHVFLLGGLVEGFHTLTGDYNVGIAVYTILQMMILAGVFGYTIHFLKRFHVPGVFRLLTLLFYGLSPVIQLFAISSTKDVLFTAAELLFFMQTIRYFKEKESFLKDKKNSICFGSSAFATMILRHNGFYIVLLVLCIMLWDGRRTWKKLLPLLVCILLPYFLYTGPIYSLLHVEAGGIEEMLSVPVQQLARVHQYDYDSLKQEDLELLYSILPKENLEAYRATVSDFVKSGFQREAFEQNKMEFFKLWVRWGLQHPLTYANSFLVNTVDAWYPGAVIDGYRDAYDRSSYFDYQVDEPGTERIFLPRLHEWYETISFDKEVQQKPFAFLILSPGWYFVVYLVLFAYVLYHRKYEYAVPFLILLLTMFTVLLGPMALVRYLLIFYYAFPILWAAVLYDKRYEKLEK